MWTLFTQQQQRGAQLEGRQGATAGKARQPGEPPAEADRAVQTFRQFHTYQATARYTPEYW